MTEKILPIISYDALLLEVFCGNTLLGMKFGNLLEIKETAAGDAVRPHSFEPKQRLNHLLFRRYSVLPTSLCYLLHPLHLM